MTPSNSYEIAELHESTTLNSIFFISVSLKYASTPIYTLSLYLVPVIVVYATWIIPRKSKFADVMSLVPYAFITAEEVDDASGS